MSIGIFALQFHHAAVEAERAHQGFAAVPGEKHFGLRLHLNVFAYELLQQLVAHHVARDVGVEFRFLGIITIGTS